MFRWFSIIGFASVLIGIVLHHLLFPCGNEPRFSIKPRINKKVHLLAMLFPEKKLRLHVKIHKLVFLLGLLSFSVLVMTGFVPLVFGYKLHGYLLMIHATFAPVFIGCSAIIVLFGAGEYAFNKKDAEAIPPGFRCSGEGCWVTDTGIGAKVGFWLLAAMALPVTLTMVLSMLPLFGTEGQEFLYDAHRWSALGFGLLAIIELYMLIRMGIRKDLNNG